MNIPFDSLWLEMPETSEVARFLEGPQPRSHELLRAFRIFWEFVRGFRRMHFIGPCVTVFGSARFGEDHPYYRIAREIGMRLAQAGFAVMTGGGPGVMEAANRGARDVDGRSIGCNIRLPKGEGAGPGGGARGWRGGGRAGGRLPPVAPGTSTAARSAATPACRRSSGR